MEKEKKKREKEEEEELMVPTAFLPEIFSESSYRTETKFRL